MPVLGIPTSAGTAVFASNFGRPQQPGWYHNLRADPAATVTVGGHASAVHAVEAGGELRERLWRAGLEVFPGWSAYAEHAGGRDIAVFLLPEQPSLMQPSPTQPSPTRQSRVRPSRPGRPPRDERARTR